MFPLYRRNIGIGGKKIAHDAFFGAVCYFFLKSSVTTVAMDNSKVLVLDTKNLKGYWDDHGSDYSVTLARRTADPRYPVNTPFATLASLEACSPKESTPRCGGSRSGLKTRLATG